MANLNKTMSSSNSQQNPDSAGIIKTFRDSLGPRQGKSISLHPRLYSGLYHRANEIKALDKILNDLTAAVSAAKKQDYSLLPKVISIIEEAINGKTRLPWWHLFTLTLNRGLANPSEESETAKEIHYLTKISEILTDIIRHYRSTDTHLLLKIRLTALDIDSRLIELESHNHLDEMGDFLSYLNSQFNLFNEEIDSFRRMYKNDWKDNLYNLMRCIEKVNQLMHLLANTAETDPSVHQQFMALPKLQHLHQNMDFFLRKTSLVPPSNTLNFWNDENLKNLFKLFFHLPGTILAIPPKELWIVLKRADELFIENPNTPKQRPAIFASCELKDYIVDYNADFTKSKDHLQAVIKGFKEDRNIRQNPVEYFKEQFLQENNLYHICGKVRFKSCELASSSQRHPSNLQKEIINRMVSLANISQPRDLDAILKSLSEEEKEDLYFLTQEIILEQFIRWRKQGVY